MSDVERDKLGQQAHEADDQLAAAAAPGTPASGDDALLSEVDQIMATIVAPVPAAQAFPDTDETSEGGAPDGEDEAADLAQEAPAITEDGLPLSGPEGPVVGLKPAIQPARHAKAAKPTDLEEDTGDKHPKRWSLVLLALVVLVVGCYLAGVVAFMQYFMPNTTLNGEDVSLKTAKEVAASASDVAESLSLDVTGQGIELSITSSSVKAYFDSDAYARAAIRQQHPWLWPLEIASTHQLEVDKTPSYDAMLLSNVVESAVVAANKDATKPVDATIGFDEATLRYAITPEVAGTTLDAAAVLDEVRDALGEHKSSVELTEGVLVQPEVTSTDERLTSAVKEANACLEATQELIARNEVVATVAAEDLHKWIALDDELNVIFDSEACTTWARGELSERLDSTGSKRSFTTPDGRQITVEGGTYGWCIDGADIAEQIAENVQAGEAAKIEVSWLTEAKEWNPGGNDWGDTYIEIDLGAQHVRYFQGGKVTWESDCVSGGLNSGEMHSTPTGVYYINSNMQSGNVELKGEIDPKTNEPEYISYVKYWMPFLNNSHALHDADWRSEFGGEIYKSNGSHGCVNLPPDKAAELYGMVSVGTVVVIHD